MQPKLYHLDITIHNNHGELLDTRRSFDSMDELNAFMTDSLKMHNLWNEAEDNGKRDGILYEELFNSNEEADFATAPLNEPWKEEQTTKAEEIRASENL